MTANEIRKLANSCDDGAWQAAELLKEIAAQLAEHNDIQRQLLEIQLEARAEQRKINSNVIAVLDMQAAERANAAVAPVERTRRR